MSRVLQLKFKNEAGKQTTLALSYVNNNLAKETVEQAMRDLAALEMFRDKKGDLMYQKPVSAKYVETNDTDIVPVSK